MDIAKSLSQEHDIDKLFKDHQDASSSFSVYEAHTLNKGDAVVQPQTRAVNKDTLMSIVDAKEWLPFAAEKYKISPDFSDYVIVPVEIIFSDIPNRNALAFPAEELMNFNPQYGMQAYRTWIGKGTYMEHQDNTIPEKAKGVIISVAVRKVNTAVGDFIRLMHLLAFDRTKDAQLASDILNRRRTGYSMGSTCETYTCSICGANMRDRPFCEHIDVRSRQAKATMRLFGDRLAFCQSRNVIGFECSSVMVPANYSARNENYLKAPG